MLQYIFLLFILTYKIIFAKQIVEKKICYLNPQQIKIAQTVFNLAKNYKSKYGMSFENALVAIYIVETSLGKSIIGDLYTVNKQVKLLNETSLGIGQIKLGTASLMIKKYDLLKNKYFYLVKKNPFSYRIYNRYIYNILYIKSLLRYNKNKWNKKTINKYKKLLSINYKKLNNFEKDIIIDDKIINLLINNLIFNIEISVHWLIYNYDKCVERRCKYPYWSAISAYNGGYNNKKYIYKVKKALRIVNCLKHKNLLK